MSTRLSIDDQNKRNKFRQLAILEKYERINKKFRLANCEKFHHQKNKNHLTIICNLPIANHPLEDSHLDDLNRSKHNASKHHSSDITLRHNHNTINHAIAHKSKEMQCFTKIKLNIPPDLRDINEMIKLEIQASILRNKTDLQSHQIKNFRFSENTAARQNHEMKRRQRFSQVNEQKIQSKAISDLEISKFKENSLKINMSKFKSQKWKLFKKKKYVDAEYFSIKPSKINKNKLLIRQPNAMKRCKIETSQINRSKQRSFFNETKEYLMNQNPITMSRIEPWSDYED